MLSEDGRKLTFQSKLTRVCERWKAQWWKCCCGWLFVYVELRKEENAESWKKSREWRRGERTLSQFSAKRWLNATISADKSNRRVDNSALELIFLWNFSVTRWHDSVLWQLYIKNNVHETTRAVPMCLLDSSAMTSETKQTRKVFAKNESRNFLGADLNFACC